MSVNTISVQRLVTVGIQLEQKLLCALTIEVRSAKQY